MPSSILETGWMVFWAMALYTIFVTNYLNPSASLTPPWSVFTQEYASNRANNTSIQVLGGNSSKFKCYVILAESIPPTDILYRWRTYHGQTIDYTYALLTVELGGQ